MASCNLYKVYASLRSAQPVFLPAKKRSICMGVIMPGTFSHSSNRGVSKNPFLSLSRILQGILWSSRSSGSKTKLDVSKMISGFWILPAFFEGRTAKKNPNQQGSILKASWSQGGCGATSFWINDRSLRNLSNFMVSFAATQFEQNN